MTDLSIAPLLRIQLTGKLSGELIALDGANVLQRVRITGRIVDLLKQLGVTVSPRAPRSLESYMQESQGDHAQAALAYYVGELQGLRVDTPIGPVQLSRKGFEKFKQKLAYEPLKAALIEHLVDILKTGVYEAPVAPYKPRKDGVALFHFAQKEVQVGAQLVTAGVMVAQDDQGRLFYSLTHSGMHGWQKRNSALDSALMVDQGVIADAVCITEAPTQVVLPGFILDDAGTSLADDELNITILAVRSVGENEEASAPAYEIVEHETRRGKVRRGIIRTDLTYAQAKAIDEYTFKKNGGYFIREKHLATMGLVPAGGGEPAPVPALDPEAEALRQQQREIERQQREADRLANEQERERRRVAEQVAALRKVAASSLEKATEELNRDRVTNTARRAGMAASILERAEKERALSVTLGNLADAIEQGKATHLAGLTSKAQLATLHNALVGGRHRAQTGLSYVQQQELKYSPLSGKDAGYAQLPRLFMNHDYDAVQRALETGKPQGWQALSRQLKLQNRDNIDPVLYNAVWKALESVGKTDAFNWYGRDQLAKRNRLTRMGLTTDDELRVALGEYLQYKEGVREEDPIAKAERAIIGQKVGIDFFPTPKGEASNMASLAQITKGMRVLEPSAGNGNLADAARAAGADVDVIEISDSLRKILEAKGYNLVAHDFMEFTPEQPYDAILMNPPFSNRRDAEHIRHAFGMLKPGGHLVAIAGEGVFNGSDAKAVAFRDWLDQHGAEVEPLAKGTFEDKKLLATTGANARRIVMVR